MKKKCSRCKEEKEEKYFNKCSVNKDGLSYLCKDCVNADKRISTKKKRDSDNSFYNSFL